MAESPIDFQEINEIVRTLLFQQFYHGGDEIVGRAKDISVIIPGVGEMLAQFLNHIVKITVRMFIEDIPRFLLIFQNEIFMIDSNRILEQYNANQAILGHEMNPMLQINFLLGEALLEMHKKSFERIEMQVEQKAVRSIVQNYTYEYVQEKIMSIIHSFRDKLKDLYGKNDKHVSMLYSLAYLLRIAQIEQYPEIIEKVQEKIEEFSDLLVKVLCES
jgi:hypothetical protein